MNKLTTVAAYSFPHEAHIARASLEAADIHAVIVDEHTIAMQWFYSDALGGVKLLVKSTNEEEARSILSSDFSSALDHRLDSDLRLCHFCHSQNVEPYTNGKKSALLTILLLGFPLFFIKRGIRCKDCGRFHAG